MSTLIHRAAQTVLLSSGWISSVSLQVICVRFSVRYSDPASNTLTTLGFVTFTGFPARGRHHKRPDIQAPIAQRSFHACAVVSPDWFSFLHTMTSFVSDDEQNWNRTNVGLCVAWIYEDGFFFLSHVECGELLCYLYKFPKGLFSHHSLPKFFMGMLTQTKSCTRTFHYSTLLCLAKKLTSDTRKNAKNVILCLSEHLFEEQLGTCSLPSKSRHAT